ncbi:PGPGW domain-containing protein [Pseudohaliea sp.]|uniref:PGPGW domain-containing protein n=1 Tax=Pseudohaliea sp. TaxID=2740289 RepID=UPI0032EC8C16
MEHYLWWITGASLLSAIATLLAMPWVVTRLPEDYFDHRGRESWRQSESQPIVALLLGLLKNVVGAVLLALGVVMLFTPGQGLLTILAGLLLMNFPGKYRLERWLVQRPGVLKSLNWLRTRRGKAPFRLS